MDTLEGNKLIAEFVGMRETNIPGFFDTTGDEFLSKFWVGSVPFDEVRFDKSWDWLMPVIEKIENIDIINNGYDFPKVKFLGDNVEIFAYATYRGTAYYWKKWYTVGGKWVCHTNQATTKIEAAWLAVVEFIKWYNTQKQ